jgi:hypothetical protein
MHGWRFHFLSGVKWSITYIEMNGDVRNIITTP